MKEVISGLLFVGLGQLEALIGRGNKNDVVDSTEVVNILHGLLDNVHTSADVAVPTESHNILVWAILDALLEESNELQPGGILELRAKLLALLCAPP